MTVISGNRIMSYFCNYGCAQTYTSFKLVPDGTELEGFFSTAFFRSSAGGGINHPLYCLG